MPGSNVRAAGTGRDMGTRKGTSINHRGAEEATSASPSFTGTLHPSRAHPHSSPVMSLPSPLLTGDVLIPIPHQQPPPIPQPAHRCTPHRDGYPGKGISRWCTAVAPCIWRLESPRRSGWSRGSSPSACEGEMLEKRRGRHGGPGCHPGVTHLSERDATPAKKTCLSASAKRSWRIWLPSCTLRSCWL